MVEVRTRIMRTNPDLSEYSDIQLRNELAARAAQRNPKPRPFKPCDNCRHFVFHRGSSDPPPDFNPCARGHRMSFRQPQDYQDEDWGHYRDPCADRRKKPKIDLTSDD